MQKERVDELLELSWILREQGVLNCKNLVERLVDDNALEVMEGAMEEGLISTKNGLVTLTQAGEQRAEGIVRRHRLVERLFSEVFELDANQTESNACQFEHILSEDTTDSVCTFLGHPPTCPHGKPIPRGECCKKYNVELRPLVMRLTDFEVGEMGRIVFIVPTERERLSKLAALGVIAGNILRLTQKRPSYVIQVDETTIALDPEIAREIYVKSIN